jgi:hypothetical protein
MKLLSYLINFIAIFAICIIAYLIYPFATDYHEYNDLYNCVNYPWSCPANINIYNYSIGLRGFFIMLSWMKSFFLLELIVIVFTIYQLNILARKQNLNYLFILIVFFAAFLKDYYLNAFTQALALSVIIFSLNQLSKKRIVLKILSSLIHISSLFYFIKIINIFLFITTNNTILSLLINLSSIFIGDISNKLNYYIEVKSYSEGIIPLVIKTFFFLIAYNTSYIRNSPYKSIYLFCFMVYSTFLTIDILANRILSIGKIFEILAFASMLRVPHKKRKIILSFTYMIILILINFI